MGNQQASSPAASARVEKAKTVINDNMDLIRDLESLNIKTEKHINILLLGETGIGKSTFINSIFNYLHYGDFEKAESDRQLTVLIPAMFTCFDKHTKMKTVTVGSTTDKNELLSIGESGTKDVKTYTFKIQNTNTMVRLIDTPGMGDTDGGLEKDNIHCENILSYISGLEKLQAICFLFKPKTTRLNAFFKYCMDQILSRLEKSASQNLVFVFTNTRGDDYSPGDTFSILQRVVKEIEERPPHVRIPLKSNLFCFDNEAFRYLAAVKQGVEFFANYRKCCKESWEKSTQECWKMINYIDQLSPHLVQQTSAVNEARRMIYQLSQPMAEIAEVINDNLYVLNGHEAHLTTDNLSLSEMRKKLYIPVINLKVIKLTQPVTVCTDRECADVYKVGEVNKWHYKQRCHDPCYLQNVPKEIIGSPELINCAAINKSTQMCDQCSHRYSVHMHVYYMTETVQEQQLDETMSRSVNTKELILENARKVIKNIKIRKNELEEELDIIINCNAQFAHFLQHNAITPFSDSYAEYIQHLIIREKALGNQANPETLKNFKKLLAQHNEIKGVFDRALDETQRLGVVNDNNVTPEKIRQSIEALFRLKHNGQKIQELYNSQSQSRKKEHTFAEYVHPTAFTKSAPPEKKVDQKGTGRNTTSTTSNNQNQRARSYNHNNNNNRNQRSQSNGPRPRRHSPPPAYNSSTNLSGQSRDYRPHQDRPSDYRAPPAQQSYYPPPPAHTQTYIPPPADAYRPPPYDHPDRSRYSTSGSDAVDNRSKSAEPTSIQVSLTLPSRDGASSETTVPNEPYYRRDAHPPPRSSYVPQDPYYPRDDPRYPPRDPYYRPETRDPYYASRDPYYPPVVPARDPYYPPRDDTRDSYYPPRDAHRDPYYPPRDTHYPPNDPYNRREPSNAPPPREPGYNQHDNHYRRGNDGSHNSQRGRGYNHRGRGNFNRGRGGNYRRNNRNNDGNDSDSSVASSKK